MSGCLVFPLRMPPPSSPFGPYYSRLACRVQSCSAEMAQVSSQRAWNTASVARKSTCSKRLPEYCRDAPDMWSVFCGAGITTSMSVTADSGEFVLAVNAATFAPAFAAVSAAFTTLEVVPDPEATTSRSPARIAGVVVSPAMWTVRPKMHQPHSGHPENQAAAACPCDEHPVNGGEMGGQVSKFLFIDAVCRLSNLAPDQRDAVPDGGGCFLTDRCRYWHVSQCLSFEGLSRI